LSRFAATVESAGDYWLIWSYLLEAAGLKVQLAKLSRPLARRQSFTQDPIAR
jgi:hypothetical protein